MVYLELFIAYVKIGLFSFGGGYAMIPLMQKEIEAKGWLSTSEFVDIIAISEMTPGPIAINSATFVGYKTAGFFGGAVATAGVVMPSLVLLLIISGFFFKFRKNPLNISIFYCIRPAVVGLIAIAALLVARTVLIKEEINHDILKSLISQPFQTINIGGIGIFVASLLAIKKLKLNPILVIALAGVAGIAVFGAMPRLLALT